MDYKYTTHIEYQAPTFLEAQELSRRISDAIAGVLRLAAVEAKLDTDAYRGDEEISKGWASEMEQHGIADLGDMAMGDEG